MAFQDRFSYFIDPFSVNLQRHLKREHPKSMEIVYDAAIDWATIETSNLPSTSSRRSSRPFRSSSTKQSSNFSKRPHTRSYTKSQQSTHQEEEDLDTVDVATVECYNCHEIGHYARDCKKPPSQKRRQFARSSGKGKQPARKGLYHTEISEGDESDYSEESESDTQDDSDLGDVQMLEALYEIQDGGEVIRRKDKQPLPVFEGNLNGHFARIIVDSGATSQFFSEKFMRKSNLPVQGLQSRTVRVADDTKSIRSGFATLNLQAGTMPSEKIAAYTFPLQHFDLILGRPWLKKHNPHINWATDSLELSINGRTYQWHPIANRDVPSTTCEEPEESVYLTEEIGPSDQVFLVTMDSTGQNRQEKRGFARKIGKWIKRKCSNLLRAFGTPAKVDEFKIDTGTNPPIRIRPRPHSPMELKGIEEFLNKYLAAGVIQPSQSPWSAPLILVKKPTGAWRICVDYRALNSITTKDAHPLPRIDDSYMQLQGARFFTSLDMQNGYWQMPLDKDSIPKTAFSSRYGQYEWRVMPQGLTNAPAGFQRAMNKILRPYLDKFCMVYLDDILIYSRTEVEHKRHVKTILRTLDEAKMILNLEKCQFFQQSIRFLGHIISAEGIEPDPDKILKILQWPLPKNITQLRGFLAICSYYRQFIKSFSTRAAPLSDLTRGSPKKNSRIMWFDAQEMAWVDLKNALTTYPVLRHVDPEKDYILDVDASNFGSGGCLQQYSLDENGKLKLHPVAYMSKKFNQTQQNYSAQEREMLAVVQALEHWRHIIEGAKITIRTDHESLKHFRSQKVMSRRLARFIDIIEHFDPEIVYRPGKNQQAADALSRIPGFPIDSEEIGDNLAVEEEIPDLVFDDDLVDESLPDLVDDEEDGVVVEEDVVNLIDHENTEKFYDALIEYLEAGNVDDETLEAEVCKQARYYVVRGGKLWRLIGNGKRVPVVYKYTDILDVIEGIHADLGHYGAAITAESIKKRYYIPHLVEEVNDVISCCVPCLLHRKTKSTSGPLHEMEPQPAFHTWGMDFVGPLPETRKGHQYLLNAVDFGTGMAVSVSLKRRSWEAAVNLVEKIKYSFGKALRILTDNGSEFLSDKFEVYLKRNSIEHAYTTPGHPQTNGKVERYNSELTKRLQRLCQDNSKEWDENLDQARFAYLAHHNQRLGQSPFFLTYGVEPTLPSENNTPSDKPLTATEIDDMQQRRQHHVQNLGKYRTDAAQKYRDAFSRLADNRDDNYPEKAIAAGDLVMRKPINLRNKLWPSWDGPFVVVDYTDKDTYQLGSANGYIVRRLVNGERLRKLSEKELKKYRGEFWNASSRLKVYDQRAKMENELHDADMEMRKVALENMELQRIAAELKAKANANANAKAKADAEARASMVKLADASKEKKRKEEEYRRAELEARKDDLERQAEAVEKLEEKDFFEEKDLESTQSQNHKLGRGKRVKKVPWKLQDTIPILNCLQSRKTNKK
jgi:hypothetical protein